MQIAVVADVHLHDLHGGYGMVDEGSGELVLRTLADTMASTRVFNESHAAFLATLDDIVTRGIRDVVLLGDYSDDGQISAVAAVKRILSSYEKTHGLRFFTTFGNHDSYGPTPRHLAKLLTKADGLRPLLVTSDDRAPAPAVICAGMRGMSSAEAMEVMALYGIDRPADVFHWETPVDRASLDASYLVEPQQGLWLLMLDANVFQQIGDVWQVKADAAWDHVLATRPYLLDWMEDVGDRAKRLGKTLLAFSHYPVLPLALTGEGADAQAACTPEWLTRMPSVESGRRIARAGISCHFSGHMHVAGRVELDGLVNIAVPSPVAYPGGYVVVTVQADCVDVEAVRFEEVAGFDAAFPAYEVQSGDHNGALLDKMLDCATYSDFLRVHLQNLIETKHVPNDWPPSFLACLDAPIGQVFRKNAKMTDINVQWSHLTSLPLRRMVEDYYLLRAGGRQVLGEFSPERVAFYRALDLRFKSSEFLDHAGFLALFTACANAVLD